MRARDLSLDELDEVRGGAIRSIGPSAHVVRETQALLTPWALFHGIGQGNGQGHSPDAPDADVPDSPAGPLYEPPSPFTPLDLPNPPGGGISAKPPNETPPPPPPEPNLVGGGFSPGEPPPDPFNGGIEVTIPFEPVFGGGQGAWLGDVIHSGGVWYQPIWNPPPPIDFLLPPPPVVMDTPPPPEPEIWASTGGDGASAASGDCGSDSGDGSGLCGGDSAE